MAVSSLSHKRIQTMALVSLVTLTPLLLGIVGIKLPEWVSFTTLLSGGQALMYSVGTRENVAGAFVIASAWLLITIILILIARYIFAGRDGLHRRGQTVTAEDRC